jgi:hydrogenase nickel incorporation protein HypA/HybF
MHELAIAQAILEQASAIANARRVTRITLCIGPLAGVAPKLLAAAFPFAAAGSCCEGAALCFETIAVRVECQTCGASSGAKPNRLLCAACGDWRVALLSGDEMRLESLELLAEETADV